MSVATIGAVGLTDTDLIIPGVPQIPYALLLTGAGSTTEVIEVRSLQRGGHVYVTRGAFGSLPVAHTAPVVVTLYDPNSGGGGGGGGVTVTGSQGGSVAGATTLQVPGPVAQVSAGIARSAGVTIVSIPIVAPALTADLCDLVPGDVLIDAWIEVHTKFLGGGNLNAYYTLGDQTFDDNSFTVTRSQDEEDFHGETDYSIGYRTNQNLAFFVADSGRLVPGTVRNASTLVLTLTNDTSLFLDTDINNSTTTVVFQAYDADLMPAAPFTIQIESEKMRVTAYNSGTYTATVTRGYQSTTPASHADQPQATIIGWAPSSGSLTAKAIIASPAS